MFCCWTFLASRLVHVYPMRRSSDWVKGVAQKWLGQFTLPSLYFYRGELKVQNLASFFDLVDLEAVWFRNGTTYCNSNHILETSMNFLYPPQIWYRSVPQLEEIDRAILLPPWKMGSVLILNGSGFQMAQHVGKWKQVYIASIMGLHPPKILCSLVPQLWELVQTKLLLPQTSRKNELNLPARAVAPRQQYIRGCNVRKTWNLDSNISPTPP